MKGRKSSFIRRKVRIVKTMLRVLHGQLWLGGVGSSSSWFPVYFGLAVAFSMARPDSFLLPAVHAQSSIIQASARFLRVTWILRSPKQFPWSKKDLTCLNPELSLNKFNLWNYRCAISLFSHFLFRHYGFWSSVHLLLLWIHRLCFENTEPFVNDFPSF